MNQADAAAPSPAPSTVERLTGYIALLGGLLLLCTASLVVVSVIGRRFFNAPVNGDFELVQMATAVAVFSFLPYCQARRGNIFVDTFTGWLPARLNAFIDAFWDLVYAGIMGLITTCLATGAMEHFRSGQTTMLLQLIVWPALAICTTLSLVLTCVALASAIMRVRGRP